MKFHDSKSRATGTYGDVWTCPHQFLDNKAIAGEGEQIMPAMAIWVVEFSSGGYKITKIFYHRINILKGNYLILRIGSIGEVSKIAKI